MLLSGVLFVLLLAGCWVYCLTDAALTPASEFRRYSKNTWIYIIAATFVAGALAWLVAGRTRRARSWVISQEDRGPLANDDFTWYSTWTDADAAIARHPASRSRQAPGGAGSYPKGPDDDPEFLRQLDRRIRGTSADPGELSGPSPVSLPSAVSTGGECLSGRVAIVADVRFGLSFDLETWGLLAPQVLVFR